jgi:hypothetical protein
MRLSKELESKKNITVHDRTSENNTVINLAEVVQGLEKIKVTKQEKTDEELYVFDMNGNKVIL